MKKILVPTDFSQSSLKALDYALNFGRFFQSEITIMWVNSAKDKEQLSSFNHTAFTKEAQERMQTLVDEVSKKTSCKIQFCFREGRVHTEVANQAKYDNSDLVICGTHGASGFENDFLGSNAYRIVNSCECPVLSIRPNYRTLCPSGIIILPIDSSVATRQKANPVVRIALATDSKVHILGLYSSSLSSVRRKVDSYVHQVEKHLASYNVAFQTEFRETNNETESTIQYATTVDADLICIMTAQELSAYNFFLGTYAHQMVNNSPIPVLSVHPKNTTHVDSKI